MPALEHKELGCLVPIEDFQEFRDNFPQYGATSWLIINAVRCVNQLIREQPELKDIVHFAIARQLLAKRQEKLDGPETTDGTPADFGSAA